MPFVVDVSPLIGDAIDRAGVVPTIALAGVSAALAIAASLRRPEPRTPAHPAMLGAVRPRAAE